MSYEITFASFLPRLREPTPQALFREEYAREKKARKQPRSRRLLDASAIDVLRATEVAHLHG